MFEPQFLL